MPALPGLVLEGGRGTRLLLNLVAGIKHHVYLLQAGEILCHPAARWQRSRRITAARSSSQGPGNQRCCQAVPSKPFFRQKGQRAQESG